MLSNQIATNIDQDDTVVLYPTFGHLTRQARAWRIPITGSVYVCGDPCRRKQRWLALLQRLNRFHPTEEQRELFERRVSQFVVPTQRGKRLALRVGQEIYPLTNETTRAGLLSTTLMLPVSAVDHLDDGNEWLSLEVVGQDGDGTGYRGAARLLGATGLSVISDIDDTVKVTHVPCRRALLEHTFLKEFEAIDGMSKVYRKWAEQGAAFHYVSSSPWQLYGPLAQLFDRAQLPPGTFHLRGYQLHEHVLRRFGVLRKRAKASVLKALLMAFPQRRFVLVGDSGERDPEIYGQLALQFGSQIRAICIREVLMRGMSARRCAHAFGGLRKAQWQVFQDPRELPAEIVACGT